MAKAFSVFVNIGGHVAPSLGAAIRATESAVAGMGRRITAVNARTTATINNLGKGVASVGKRMQNAGGALSAGVTTPLGILGKIGFDAAYQFEKVANAVQAVGDMTGEQRDKLKAYAKELNAAFPVNNAQILSAAEELAKAGFNYEQVYGALKSTLNLATAGDIDLKSSAEIASNVLTSMNLPRKTAGEASESMRKVADALAYAANRSNTDVRMMGETFKYVGPMARAAGLSIADVSAASMIMANNGIKGAEAGVALRSAMVRMVKPTKPMLSVLERLNVNISEFVTGGRKIASTDILGSLAVDGIDASGARKAIDKILSDSALQKSPGELIKRITAAVSSSLGSESVVDKDKLSESIQSAVTAAGSQVDLAGFFKALRGRGVSLPDVARIFDSRQGARLITLLFEGDLAKAADEVAKSAEGAADRMRELRLQGIVGQVGELSAAWENLWVTLGETGVLKDIGRGLTAIADGLEAIGKQSPALLRFATWGVMATAALGPFLLVAGTAGRVLGAMATGLMMLGAAATTSLAASLVSVAVGVRAVAAAALLGAAGRLRAMAAGLIALSTVGGSRAVLGAIGASILSFGRTLLMFPLTALRGIASVLLGIGTLTGAAIIAITAALVGLGVWVYNNWQGITSFFSGFADGFAKAFGSTPKGWIDAIGSSLGTVWKFVSDLLGPINATNEAWKGWGETVGGVVARAVNAVADGISRVVGLFTSAYDGAVKLKNAIMSLGGGGVDTSGASKAGAIAGAAISGARAAGGPVSVGKTYLVGERGPELFTPGRSGGITANDNLRALSSPEAVASVSGGRSSSRGGGMTQTNTFHIQSNDPQAVAREVERVLRRYEDRQHALLSD